ncbi:MAG: hypothetical protein JNM34_12565 [Chthonomonadaceae bacterium]|nr:hypothetical protein [Chthonomonadaceae bacterium]
MFDPKTNFGQLLFATTLIECRKPGDIISYGTAFVFDYEVEPGRDFPLLVTCGHTVTDSITGGYAFTVQGPDDGSGKRSLQLGKRVSIQFEDFSQSWFFHPDPNVDVAVQPLVPVIQRFQEAGYDPYTNSIPLSMCPSHAALGIVDVHEQVVFVGYPYGLQDERHSLPLVRTGFTASSFHICYNGLPGFYVDGHFHPGSSGSPVCIIDKLFATRQDGAATYVERGLLLGLATSADKAPSGDFEDAEIGLGFVTSSDMIVETSELYLKSLGII